MNFLIDINETEFPRRQPTSMLGQKIIHICVTGKIIDVKFPYEITNIRVCKFYFNWC